MTTATASTTVDNLLDLQNVTKAYRLETKQFLAVQDVNLHIRPGEFVCLLGPIGMRQIDAAADHHWIERRYFRRGLVSRAAAERRQSIHDDRFSNIRALPLADGAGERGSRLESARRAGRRAHRTRFEAD